MSSLIVKTHYSAAELVKACAPGLPTSKAAMIARADREAWPYVEVTGVGGLRREYAPPANVMEAVKARVAQRLVTAVQPTANVPAVRVAQQRELLETDAQRLTADARKGILTTLDRLMEQCHISRETAMITLLTQAKAGTLDDHMVMMLKAARDERGRKGDGFPSVRTLKRWLAQEKAGDLTPKKVQADYSVPEWARAFLPYYQQPQKPSVELAYREFEKAYRMRDRAWEFPTIHQVRRFLGKVGNVSRQVGRVGPREMKNLRGFTRRTFVELWPNDVWSADGHTFDAEVQHPLHGRPFRPEITAIIDIATRRVTGFSIGLAESSLVVLEAISHAVLKDGIPGTFYVDNGSGYKNHLLKREGTGLQGLLGFEVKHSTAYNSQAKGVIERSHQTLWIQAAKLLPSYVGSSMDRETRLAQFKITRQAVRKGGVMPLIGWDDFVRFCEERVDEYNNRPHRTLPKMIDAKTGKSRHMSPNEVLQAHRDNGWEPSMLAEHERQHVFRPRVERTVQRCEIALFNNRYFSTLLTEFNGEVMHIAYDIHDAQRVWVHHPDGRLICTAELGANEQPYFGMSVIEQGREKRAEARLKRLDAHRDEIEAERRGHPALLIDTPEVITIPGFGDITRDALNRRFVDAEPVIEVDTTPVRASEPAPATAEIFELPEKAEQRFARWQALHQHIDTGGVPDQEELRWYGTYPLTKEFAAQKRRAESAEEWQLASQQ